MLQESNYYVATYKSFSDDYIKFYLVKKYKTIPYIECYLPIKYLTRNNIEHLIDIRCDISDKLFHLVNSLLNKNIPQKKIAYLLLHYLK